MAIQPDRRAVIGGLALAPFATRAAAAPVGTASPTWQILRTDPFKGKQDDIVFVDRLHGWYGNGKGRVYGTEDGGDSWSLLWEQPGTYVRALGFVDRSIGILGNIGVDDFPDVTDPHPVYRTTDGGRTWAKSERIDGPTPKGICAIDVLRHPYINAGRLDTRVTIRAGGRVGGPAHLMTSHDLGVSWRSEDLSQHTGAILDIRFLNERIGFIAGSSSADVDSSNAVVLRTMDGGASWQRVYQSRRPFEITWKLSFPSPRVGYVTVQSYDDDKKRAARFVAKTTDGGATWREFPMTEDHDVQEFGIAFIDERRGWVGATPHGFETRDGGRSWSPADLGKATNKIRVVRDAGGTRLFSIGYDVRRLDLP